MKASDVRMRDGHSLDLQGQWANGDILLLTHEMCYGGRVHVPSPVVCIHLVLKGAGELLSTGGLFSRSCPPGSWTGYQHGGPSVRITHEDQSLSEFTQIAAISEPWPFSCPLGVPACTAQMPACFPLRSGLIARSQKPWQHERVMSERQLGLFFLQQDLNFLPSSCGSLKLTFALSINFTSSRQRWQMSPFIGAALSTPARLLIKESPTRLEENLEFRLNIRGPSNLPPTQCKGPLCKTPQKALQPLLDHFQEQRAQ